MGTNSVVPVLVADADKASTTPRPYEGHTDPCGGRFAPGANPKCAQCGRDLAHQDDPLKRLTDPHMIAIDGACVYSDDSEPYQVRIVD